MEKMKRMRKAKRQILSVFRQDLFSERVAGGQRFGEMPRLSSFRRSENLLCESAGAASLRLRSNAPVQAPA